MLSLPDICKSASLVICPKLGANNIGIFPDCYARNYWVSKIGGGRFIFQLSTLMVDAFALILVLMMIYNVQTKYTAVGRKEMSSFFVFYFFTTVIEILTISFVIPPSEGLFYVICASCHVGAVTATVTCLLVNGFVGFQWSEDGTATSVWTVRILSLIMFGAGFVTSFGTLTNKLGMNSASPSLLFLVYIVYNGVAILLYVFTQTLLVIKVAINKVWPLGALYLSFFAFIMSQVSVMFLSPSICRKCDHSFDGLVVAAALNLFAVMMIYKYWDAVTEEDLEFTIGSKNIWEIRDEGNYSHGSSKEYRGY